MTTHAHVAPPLPRSLESMILGRLRPFPTQPHQPVDLRTSDQARSLWSRATSHANVVRSVGRRRRLPLRNPQRWSSRYAVKLLLHLSVLETTMGLGSTPWRRRYTSLVPDRLDASVVHYPSLACAETCMAYRTTRCRTSSFGGRSGKRLVDDRCIRRQASRRAPASSLSPNVGCAHVPAQLCPETDFLIVVALLRAGMWGMSRSGYIVVLRSWLVTGNGPFETASASTHSSRPRIVFRTPSTFPSSRYYTGPSSASSSVLASSSYRICPLVPLASSWVPEDYHRRLRRKTWLLKTAARLVEAETEGAQPGRVVWIRAHSTLPCSLQSRLSPPSPTASTTVTVIPRKATNSGDNDVPAGPRTGTKTGLVSLHRLWWWKDLGIQARRLRVLCLRVYEDPLPRPPSSPSGAQANATLVPHSVGDDSPASPVALTRSDVVFRTHPSQCFAAVASFPYSHVVEGGSFSTAAPGVP
uniref:Uncharacterized protein n=1 Tax=Mycena chlorophos TaxID=658473 RepID=A0ABQ0LW44_MYCCL|nr:predicted protein [Mycena chlorophos]